MQLTWLNADLHPSSNKYCLIRFNRFKYLENLNPITQQNVKLVIFWIYHPFLDLFINRVFIYITSI